MHEQSRKVIAGRKTSGISGEPLQFAWVEPGLSSFHRQEMLIRQWNARWSRDK
jgi:hypothetical protein